MTYESILYPAGGPHEAGTVTSTLHQLGIDAVVDAACAPAPWQDCRATYLTPNADPAVARYRQGVLRDLADDAGLRRAVRVFSDEVSGLADDLAAALQRFLPQNAEHLDHLARGRLLDCARRWCEAVDALDGELRDRRLDAGLRAFREYLRDYRQGAAYGRLRDDVDHTSRLLGYVRYDLLVCDGEVRVRKYQGEQDLGSRIETLFAPFREQGTARGHAGPDGTGAGSDETGTSQDLETVREGAGQTGPQAPTRPGTAGGPSLDDAVEARILDQVARDYGDQFRALANFCQQHTGFADEKIVRFAWDVRFYLSWLDLVDRMGERGLALCLPELNGDADALEGVWDLTLALDAGDPAPEAPEAVVGNDVMSPSEGRALVVCGPEASGRSSLLRACGQALWLASLGLSVPASRARLDLPGELVAWEPGRMRTRQALAALNATLSRADERTVVLLDGADALLRGAAADEAAAFVCWLLAELARRGSRALVVLGPVAPSGLPGGALCATGDAAGPTPAGPACRSHRFVAGAPEGDGPARSLAARYGLAAEQVGERVAARGDGAEGGDGR